MLNSALNTDRLLAVFVSVGGSDIPLRTGDLKVNWANLPKDTYEIEPNRTSLARKGPSIPDQLNIERTGERVALQSAISKGGKFRLA